MQGEMFDGLSPEVEALLNAAKSNLPAAQPTASLIEAMTLALSVDALAPASPRRRSMLGKALTAKAAAIAGMLVLTGGVASAATGNLPGPAQDAASTAAEHVGLHIPKSDSQQSEDTTDSNDSTDPTPTTSVHPDNHGNDVSTVAHDDSNEGADHGTAVCTVASDAKCKAGEDHSGDQGNSADHRQNGDHSATTSTTVNGDSGDNSGTDTSGDSTDSGSQSTPDHSTGDSNPGSGHQGSGG